MFRHMKSFETLLRRAVDTFIRRHGMSVTGFGQAALGDPSFGAALARGRSPRLDTADRLLAFMGMDPVGPAFRREVEAFLAATGVKLSELGRGVTGNPSFVAWLRRGGSPRLATVDRARAWMAAQPGGAMETRGAGDEPVRRESFKGENDMSDDTHRYMTTGEAAAFLRLSARTLERYRLNGAGPRFHKFGTRVLYLRADVVAWAAERGRSSTSDDGAKHVRRKNKKKRGALPIAAVGIPVLAIAMGMDPALASTDTTFQGPLDTVSGMVSGTGGQLAAALAVGAALVGSVLRFNAMQLLGAVGVGVAAGAGVGIVTGLVGTAIV